MKMRTVPEPILLWRTQPVDKPVTSPVQVDALSHANQVMQAMALEDDGGRDAPTVGDDVPPVDDLGDKIVAAQAKKRKEAAEMRRASKRQELGI